MNSNQKSKPHSHKMERNIALLPPNYQPSNVEESSSFVPVNQNLHYSIEAVEQLLNYQFLDKSLIASALTHPSFCESESYERLEFVGDAALGCAFANFLYSTYPTLDPGQLSLIRSANISTEKLARVAVRHNLFGYVRHNAPALQLKVDKFALQIQREGDEILAFGGSVKAPKVLANIVESIAAAILADSKFDLRVMWRHFSALLEPIVTPENISQQPVAMLYEHCQKYGNRLQFKHFKKGSKNITRVFVDGSLLASDSSNQKETSKLIASKKALQEMHRLQCMPRKVISRSNEVNGEVEEIREPKQKVIEFCRMNGFSTPLYSVVKEEGPPHDKRFVCQVQIEIEGTIYMILGDSKPKVKDAENSAASRMLYIYKNDAPYAFEFP